ncbi:DUF6338 family protein [Psychrosphaera algicola]|uniref:DUF6338 family protein n=1 Tax=Psychrosphaera algicola TaxID=3023714 RepID=A0ABT5FDS5_9GAMM|nr:DUF6338 family protein [Psychrosphaera sp. G1-22]MDC2889496.1 DUF6338 family protein [Psychrosphaera sp. G1-22]
MNIWELDKLYLFILFVVPGFIALKTYELCFPNIQKDSSKQLIDAATYSCVNYAFMFIFIRWVEMSEMQTQSPNLYVLFYFFVIFISPILLVLSWRKVRSTNLVQSKAPHPTGKPWDYVFSKREPYWVKVTLKDGKILGGLYSSKSFASSNPEPEQIYLEQTWVLDKDGAFERAKNDTAGILILSAEISHVELRKVKYD